MKWICYTIETTTKAEDLIAASLADLGIGGVEIENNVPLAKEDSAKMFIDIQPELPEDDGTSRVSFYLEESGDHGEILSRIREAIEELSLFVDTGSGQISESVTEDEDWINNWKEFFHPFTIEGEDDCRDILIKPTWEDLKKEDEDKILIEIDPGISFGTGRHETTRLCIRQLMKYVKKGDEVLDLGCGSGILSIVSLKLGAGHVTGTDIDDDCLASTRANFKVNHLGEETGDFYLGDLTDDPTLRRKIGRERYDIVAANILAEVIIPMVPYIPTLLKKGGVFIASGILDTKEREVCEAVGCADLRIRDITRQGEWIAVTAEK